MRWRLELSRNHEYAHIRFPNEKESTVSTGDLAPLPSIDENGLDLIEILSPFHEEDYTQVFSSSDSTPLKDSPAPTVETPLPQNATTPQSITAPPPENVDTKA
ncbi:hypothetical protein ILUMI_07165 [Ignelater luminosus]|uniref:Uncharacterized protein n=1 Tax=Ignelater luminosus TaxID=2038154 RepID=A0A8K0GH41_IGNLU|nr:hypothetical protein ILUMI_07165 [Ignelater luminosus]